MNKELQQYYEDRFTMFTTKGWKDLVEDLQRIKKMVYNQKLMAIDQSADDCVQGLSNSPVAIPPFYQKFDPNISEITQVF